MEHYWNLIKWDGEVIEVRPAAVPTVRRKLAAGDGFIQTTTRDIAVKDVKGFVETSKPYSDQKLLEGAAQAFNEPIINEDGSIACHWIKKPVTRREYQKTYRYGGYHTLREEEHYIWVAFRVPVHMITNEMRVCDPIEVGRLEK